MAILWGDLLVVITGITRAITVQHVVTGITGLGPLGRYFLFQLISCIPSENETWLVGKPTINIVRWYPLSTQHIHGYIV